MERLMPGFEVLISQVGKTASFYVTTFALFIYHVVFDEHLKCSCKHGVKSDTTKLQYSCYMWFPALILLLLTLWMDRPFQRVLRITCRCTCTCNLCGRLWALVIKAATIGLLWIVSVLIDGDWYVCYRRTMLPCRNNTDTAPSQEELEKKLETQLKRESMVYGLALVLVLLFANSILTAVPWRDICMNKFKIDSQIKPYYRALFEEDILEQTEILIEKVLKRTAKECVVLKSREILQPCSIAAPTTHTTQGGSGASSSTTHPEVEDTVITFDNLDFIKISHLHSLTISSLFSTPSSSAAPTIPPQPIQGEDRPSSNRIV